jgi:small subunit ribosomal protein S21
VEIQSRRAARKLSSFPEGNPCGPLTSRAAELFSALFSRAFSLEIRSPNRKSTFQQTVTMPEIQVKKGEPIDRALKRLKSKIETEGTLEEFRRRRQHETHLERTRRKARSAAKKKNQKFRFVP